jgi:hypothetical protein
MNAIILKGAALHQPPLPQSGPRAKTIAHPCTSQFGFTPCDKGLSHEIHVALEHPATSTQNTHTHTHTHTSRISTWSAVPCKLNETLRPHRAITKRIPCDLCKLLHYNVIIFCDIRTGCSSWAQWWTYATSDVTTLSLCSQKALLCFTRLARITEYFSNQRS